MQKLRDHLTTLANLSAESTKLDRLERDSREQVQKAVDSGNASSDKDVQLLTLASTRLNLIPATRRNLQTQIKKAVAQLHPILRGSTNAWSKFVQSKVDEEADKFYTLVAPFYNDSKRLARREISEENIPALVELRRSYFGGDIGNDDAPLDAHITHAENFLKHAEKHCLNHDWQMPE